jgi:hypothetical protein
MSEDRAWELLTRHANALRAVAWSGRKQNVGMPGNKKRSRPRTSSAHPLPYERFP